MSDLPQFIYVHGFNSSPQSFKAQMMLRVFSEQGLSEKLEVPTLPHWPAEAIEMLSERVSKYNDVLLIGSSLGGFYSTWLTEHFEQARAVLVNPAVAPHRLLVPLLGETQNYYSCEKYELTQTHLEQLTALYLPELSYPEKLLLLQQEGDETLDYRDAVRYYSASEQIVQPDGNHGFENFDRMIPQIFSYAKRET